MKSQAIRNVAAVAIAVLTSAPLIAGDSPRCGLLGAVDATPAGMSAAWLSSLQAFLETNPDLSSDQRAVIARAVELGKPATFGLKVKPGRNVVLPDLAQVIRDAKKLFSTNQLGEIFSRMGATQAFLVNFGDLDTPYCNCQDDEGCIDDFECEAGCISWSDSSDELYWGVCYSNDIET